MYDARRAGLRFGLWIDPSGPARRFYISRWPPRVSPYSRAPPLKLPIPPPKPTTKQYRTRRRTCRRPCSGRPTTASSWPRTSRTASSWAVRPVWWLVVGLAWHVLVVLSYVLFCVCALPYPTPTIYTIFKKLAGARYPLLKRVSELKLLSLTAEVRNRAPRTHAY